MELEPLKIPKTWTKVAASRYSTAIAVAWEVAMKAFPQTRMGPPSVYFEESAPGLLHIVSDLLVGTETVATADLTVKRVPNASPRRRWTSEGMTLLRSRMGPISAQEASQAASRVFTDPSMVGRPLDEDLVAKIAAILTKAYPKPTAKKAKKTES